MPKRKRTVVHSDPLLKKNPATNSFVRWMNNQEGHSVSAGKFDFTKETKRARQDENFNASDRHAEQQEALNENPYQQDNDEAMKETDPTDWTGYEVT